jgi:23S rRNA (guanosine2251-2'-O)-methyltransferase
MKDKRGAGRAKSGGVNVTGRGDRRVGKSAKAGAAGRGDERVQGKSVRVGAAGRGGRDELVSSQGAGWRSQSKEFSEKPYAYDYATLHDLIELSREAADALIVVLDHITDVGNFGAIVRSAEVVGALGLVIPKNRSVSVNDAVYRTSAGAIDHIRVAREANIADSLHKLKDAGFWVGAASEHASLDVWSAPLQGKLVIVMGAEDQGISRLVRSVCDFEFRLPQRGVTQSLNVAQAATAIMYEWLRRQWS